MDGDQSWQSLFIQILISQQHKHGRGRRGDSESFQKTTTNKKTIMCVMFNDR